MKENAAHKMNLKIMGNYLQGTYGHNNLLHGLYWRGHIYIKNNFHYIQNYFVVFILNMFHCLSREKGGSFWSNKFKYGRLSTIFEDLLKVINY